MTFCLADPDALYRTRVPVDVPAPDGPDRQECVVLFRLLPAEEARELAVEGDEAYLRGIVGGWKGIFDHGGEPLEFTDENVAALAAIPYFARALADAYGSFLLGLPGKTSAKPRATGAARRAGRTKSKKTRQRSGSG